MFFSENMVFLRFYDVTNYLKDIVVGKSFSEIFQVKKQKKSISRKTLGVLVTILDGLQLFERIKSNFHTWWDQISWLTKKVLKEEFVLQNFIETEHSVIQDSVDN